MCRILLQQHFVTEKILTIVAFIFFFFQVLKVLSVQLVPKPWFLARLLVNFPFVSCHTRHQKKLRNWSDSTLRMSINRGEVQIVLSKSTTYVLWQFIIIRLRIYHNRPKGHVFNKVGIRSTKVCPHDVDKMAFGYILHTCRLFSVDLYPGVSIIHLFRKQWQPTGYINFQEYHEQPAKAGVDCSGLKGTYS